jgi:hypothetical protein
MFRRKKKPGESLPWYRARAYKGNLTENESGNLIHTVCERTIQQLATTAFPQK